MLSDYARSQLNTSNEDIRDPYLYKKRNLNGNDIKAYLIEWRQLVQYNKDKLCYASTSLKLNKTDVEDAFLQEYSDMIEKKNTAQLHVVR